MSLLYVSNYSNIAIICIRQIKHLQMSDVTAYMDHIYVRIHTIDLLKLNTTINFVVKLNTFLNIWPSDRYEFMK